MKRIDIVILAAMAFSPAAEAQEMLTMEQCRQMALTQNKQMAASAHATAAATYTAKSYKGNFFPDISLGGTGLYSNADGSLGMGMLNLDYKLGLLYTGGVKIEQPIYMGGKISAAYRMASIGGDVAKAQQKLTATEVIMATSEAYALTVKATQSEKVARAYHKLLTELLRSVESAHLHGMKPLNDVLKVRVKLNESELATRKAENALRLAKMNLCHCIGMPLDADISVADSLTETFNIPIFTQADISARPEFAMLDSRVAAAQQEVKLNRSELLPKVGASASYNYLHGIELNDNTLLDKGSFAVMLNVSIPIFHFGERRNKMLAAKEKLQQARMEQQDNNEKMVLELTQAANNVDEAVMERDIALRSLAQAEENMRVSRRQYEAGMETIADHLEAQSLWQQACETKVDATFQLYLAHLAYQKASGTLLSAE